MNKNYMTYLLKNMRITCRYDEYSHKGHNVEVVDGLVDYPIDDAGLDSGIEAIYCPCNEMKISAIRGINDSNVTNTIWLVSTEPVITPTFTDYVYITLTHSNDNDINDLYVGKVFKRGEIICYEGTDGATANHIHITCGRGTSTSWKLNSNNKWVIYGNSLKPEEVFYLDKNFTNVIETRNINWIELPKNTNYIGTPVNRKSNQEQVEIIVSNLNARKEPNLDSEKLGYVNPGIYNVIDTYNDEKYIWKKIETFWIATTDTWVNYYKNENDDPKLIYSAPKDGKYLIYLKKDYKLCLKK